jgi:hypothetical protein
MAAWSGMDALVLRNSTSNIRNWRHRLIGMFDEVISWPIRRNSDYMFCCFGYSENKEDIGIAVNSAV